MGQACQGLVLGFGGISGREISPAVRKLRNLLVGKLKVASSRRGSSGGGAGPQRLKPQFLFAHGGTA